MFKKIDLNFVNILQLLNFLIILKKILSKDFLIDIKIIKNNKKICL